MSWKIAVGWNDTESKPATIKRNMDFTVEIAEMKPEFGFFFALNVELLYHSSILTGN